MSTERARAIRAYVDQNGGTTEATVGHLWITFDVADDDAAAPQRVADELGQAGVRIDRSLAGLGANDRVVLSTSEQPPTLPPWGAPLPNKGQRSGRNVLAASLVVLAACGAGAGGYLAGKSTGADLDAAGAAGTRDGQRVGAERGSKAGYREGFQAGREQGFKQTFGGAYTRAYKREFKKADVPVPAKVKVPKTDAP